MDFTEGTALEIIERLSTAYGVATQKALAECLGVPAANVSNWVKRDSVPGSAFVKCALDTGSNLNWLTTGKLANASFGRAADSQPDESLYKKIILNGGKPVLRRIMEAYGFTLQKQLCDLLGISSGTVSTWVRRNYFPGDVVVTCALDTGVSLKWLATGEVSTSDKRNQDISSLPTSTLHKKLIAGKLVKSDLWYADVSIFPQQITEPVLITSITGAWILDASIKDVSNGLWLLAIDGKYDIYDISVLPAQKISLMNNGQSFICEVSDVMIYGKVLVTIGCF